MNNCDSKAMFLGSVLGLTVMTLIVVAVVHVWGYLHTYL